MDKPGKHHNFSYVQVGKSATLFGRHYRVVGRIRYQAQIEEWDPQDRAFGRYPLTYDEWILEGSDESEVYITEEEGEFYFGYCWPAPANTPLAQKPEQQLRVGEKHNKQKITERGNLKVIFVEGETHGVEVGFENEYAAYQYNKEYYGLEWEIIDPGEEQDVYYFREKVLTKIELFTAFNYTELLQQEKEKQDSVKEYLIWSKFFYVIAVILGVLLVVSTLPAKEIYKKEFAFDANGTSTQTAEFGPIAMEKVGTVYNVQVAARSMYLYTDTIAVDIELLDKEKQRINFMDGELWKGDDETFSDPEVKNNYFRLTEPGSYFIRLTVTPSNKNEGTVTVFIFEGVWLSRYYLGALIIVLGILFFLRKASYYKNM